MNNFPHIPGTRTRTWLLAALALVVLPHVTRLPWWIALFVAGIGLFELVLLRRSGRRPPRAVLLLLTLAGTASVLMHYGTLLGKNAGMAMLVIMTLLKLLELRTSRDAYLLIFASYFLVITNFLFTQTPLIALYMFGATLVITATLSVTTHAAASRSTVQHLRLATLLLIQAVPIMLVLFVFFPRVVGPVWGLPQDAHAGMTGISDTLSPGAISSLVQSDAPAFRVKFSGPAPAAALRYWRGPVLWQTDGRTWTPGRYAAFRRNPLDTVHYASEPVHYTVILEAHNKPWLFTLDLPAGISVRAIQTMDFQWLAYKPVLDRTRYQATSYTRYDTGPLDPQLRTAALQLPDQTSARVQALARAWRASAASNRELVQLALDYFHNQPFVYTLKPPLLGNDPVDEFLFATRRGFCEHYATAFVMLMRSAGIPARVVTGYQGGEYNPVGDYWLIRQADAHAWAEVWLPDAGWQRVDPTAAVAPERVEYALDLGAQTAGAPARFQLTGSDTFARSWRGLRHVLDAADNYWNEWILSYGPQRQLELLARLGIREATWREMGLALFVLISTLLLVIALWMLVKQPAPGDPVLRAWQRYCACLARLGIRRAPTEGPRDYAQRIIAARPELAPRVASITDLYIRLRYGNPAHNTAGVAELQRLVRQFPRRAV